MLAAAAELAPGGDNDVGPPPIGQVTPGEAAAARRAALEVFDYKLAANLYAPAEPLRQPLR